MEDLFQNPFFRALKSKEFQPLFLQAEKNCWPILIPQAATLGKLTFSSDFFFTGEYDTLTDKVIEMEENAIKTKKGFPEDRRVKILFEELFYNKEYKQFKIYCIEQPLIGGTGLDETVKFPDKPTFENCVRFLESFEVNEIVLTKVKKEANEFNKSYLFVEGFEDHLKQKVQLLCNQAVEALICANPDFRMFHRMSGASLTQLTQIIESYVLGILHEKLFDACCQTNKVKDENLYLRLTKLQKMTQTQLDIEEDMQGDYKEAIKTCQKLEFCITPLERLYCMQEVSNQISKKVASLAVEKAKDLVVTTDNLIPLLVYVIIQAKPIHLHTNVYYTENFTFSNISTTNYGFTLITFRAAISFIESNELLPLLKYEFPVSTNRPSSVQNVNNNDFFSPSKPSTSPDPGYLNKIFATPFSKTTADLSSQKSNEAKLKRSTSLQQSAPQIAATKKAPVGIIQNYKPAPQVISMNQNKTNSEKLGGFLSSFKNK